MISAYNLGRLLFQLINTAFPDPAAPASRAVEDAMRWSIASLSVAVPVLLYLSRLTSRKARFEPAWPPPLVRWSCRLS
jgi:hypothetical protein